MGAVQNYVEVSRRPPDVEDYIDMVRRHRSWIIGPTYLGLVVAVVVAFFWPDTFESSATMRITPQTISERVAPETIDLQIDQVLQGLRTEILSRTSLTGLIERQKLYPRLVKNYTIEDAVAQMQKDATISPWADASAGSAAGRGQGAFIIRFRYPDRYKAKSVVEELVHEFMTQDVIVQSDAAKSTRSFLADQLKEAQDRLDTIQTNVAKFREENAGRLPDNALYNANQLSTLENQVNAADERINNLGMERANTENTLQSNEDLLTYMTSTAEGAPAAERVNQNLANLDRQIQSEEAILAGLRQTYRDDYPTVKTQMAKVDNLKHQRDQEQTAKPADPGKGVTIPVVSPMATATIQQQKDRIQAIQTQIDNLDLEIKRTTDGKAGLARQIEVTRAKIEASPEVEQRYSALTQDLMFAKTNYDELVRKEKESETTQDIQERHLGEQLELLDQASLPTTPVDPNRWGISAAGAAMGLMIGLVLAGAKEAKDASLKNLKDVRAYTNLPVLTSVPLLENALLVRRKRRLFWLVWTIAGIVGCAAMFISMMYYMTPKPQ
jgi:polysaccharide chain length determinant protein (PEP-CTERM system associated)